MRPRVTILCIGNELLDGSVLDTNSNFLTNKLYDLGFHVVQVELVPDEHARIREEIEKCLQLSDVVILCGGLGPTSDDLTRYVISEVVNQELEINPDSLARLENYLKSKNRNLNENNKRQVLFPKNSVIFPNPIGTADAFLCFLKSNKYLFALPGVPRELKLIFSEQITSWLQKNFPSAKKVNQAVLKVFGIPESTVGEKLDKLAFPPGISIAYRPHFPEVMLTFKSKEINGESDVKLAADLACAALGEEFIFSRFASGSLWEEVGKLLEKKSLKIALAESCSGGLIAHRIISVPGASKYFSASVVSYSNEAKQKLLGVKQSTLKQFGAVSREVALEMADGVRSLTGADIGISVSGIAGPTGGTEDKPIGSVWFGFVTTSKSEAVYLYEPREREAFRVFCAAYALDMLRRYLLGLGWLMRN